MSDWNALSCCDKVNALEEEQFLSEGCFQIIQHHQSSDRSSGDRNALSKPSSKAWRAQSRHPLKHLHIFGLPYLLSFPFLESNGEMELVLMGWECLYTKIYRKTRFHSPFLLVKLSKGEYEFSFCRVAKDVIKDKELKISPKRIQIKRPRAPDTVVQQRTWRGERREEILPVRWQQKRLKNIFKRSSLNANGTDNYFLEPS